MPLSRERLRALTTIAISLVAALLLLGVAPAAARAGGTPRREAPRDAFVPSLRADRVVMGSSLLAALRAVHARVPSYSRQTGLACSACHYQFPQLTPFGRLFKLNGYTLTGLNVIRGAGDSSVAKTLALSPIPPVAAMVVTSLTQTAKAVPGTQNGSAAFPQQMSLFLAGQITPKMGTFAQLTYAGADGSIGIDNVDVRYASHGTIGDRDAIFGLTLNNNPTVQDVWNTVPAWGYPFIGSEAAPSPMASALVDGTLGQQVVGLGAYTLLSNTLYAEGTLYRSAPQGQAQPLDSTATNTTSGVAPYWRVALQHQFGTTYAMLGTYGLSAKLYPTGVAGPTNRLTDVALDAQLERPMGAGTLIGRATYIHEDQSLDALFLGGGSTNATNTLGTTRVNLSWVPSVRWSVTGGWFGITGSSDALLYPGDAVSGSASGSPRSSGAIGELSVSPWQNTRLGLQYVAYNRFNGASRNYDGAGRSATDNNTLYGYLWLAF